MTKPLKNYYVKKINNKIETIERLQMKMNANIGNTQLCLTIEKKQSRHRVDLILLKIKLESLKEKYGKAA